MTQHMFSFVTVTVENHIF